MAAYIFENSLSKPKYYGDIERPVDALQKIDSHLWNSCLVMGEAGLLACRDAKGEPQDYQIITDCDQMYRKQDCVIMMREGFATVPAWVVWVAVGVSVAASVYAYIAAKKVATAETTTSTTGSSNNLIQSRTNEERVNSRIEYICGQVRSYPAKLMSEYIIVESNEQVEYGYYSVGEGAYLLEDVRDGRTLGESMSGWSLNAYRPNTSPMSGSPYFSIGGNIGEGLRTVFESDEAVQDEIEPPNDLSVSLDFLLSGSGTTGTIALSSLPDDYSLTDSYDVGDSLVLTDVYATGQTGTRAVYKKDDQGVDYNAYVLSENDYVNISTNGSSAYVYTVTGVTDSTITVTLPFSSGSAYDAWQNLNSTPIKGRQIYFNSASGVSSFYSTSSASEYVTSDDGSDVYYSSSFIGTINGRIVKLYGAALGPFACQKGIRKIQYNLLATQGLYKEGEGNAVSNVTVAGTVTIRELDTNDNPTGNSQTASWSLSTNSANKRKQAGDSFYITSNWDNYTIEFERSTNRDFNFEGAVYDTVELVNLYFYRDEPNGATYGDITTVQTRRKQSTYGVGTAKKINMLATRQYYENDTYTASRFFDDTLYFMALNQRFGRRTQVQADKLRTHLRAIRDEIVAYFGSNEAAYFDYTFDDQDTTFEAAVNQIAKNVFCTAYQIGSDVMFFPNILQENDAMVFSHANKIPGKETMKYAFTDLREKDYDCVEVKWRNPDNLDAQEAIYVPSQGYNPSSIELVGVRNEQKAYVHAWREWYAILYQRYSYECTVGIEATQLVPGRRVGIVNNIAGVMKDGFIKAWNGEYLIHTSQDVALDSAKTYQIVINKPTGGTEVFGVTQGRYDYELVLDALPTFDISTSLMEKPVTFRVASEDELEVDSYEMQTVSLDDKGLTIKAVNYAPERFQKDNLMA